jgi:hypothetical protein
MYKILTNIIYLVLQWVVETKVRVRVMEFNTTFNNISVILWQVLLVMETGVP